MTKIKEVNGNILDSSCEVLVNPVNTQGIMGAGLALQFKRKYPEMFLDYRITCSKNNVMIGNIFVYTLETKYLPTKYIFNFPTKTRWNLKSNYSYIKLGMMDLINKIAYYKINSIAIPALGCGLGGLDYKEVKTIILSEFLHLKGNVTLVELYEPR